MSPRPKVPKRDYSKITDDPEMLETLRGQSTIGKQATMSKALNAKINDNDYLKAQWDRVDKARAIKGKPSLPKPGSKAWRE